MKYILPLLLILFSLSIRAQVLQPSQIKNAKSAVASTSTASTKYIPVADNNSVTKLAIPDLYPYKLWQGSISQTSTSAPTATIFWNTLGGTITWARDSVGTYSGKLKVSGTGVFTTNKTYAQITPGWIGFAVQSNWTPGVSFTRVTDSTFVIRSTRNDTLMDATLNKAMIELRVYR